MLQEERKSMQDAPIISKKSQQICQLKDDIQREFLERVDYYKELSDQKKQELIERLTPHFQPFIKNRKSKIQYNEC